MAGDVGLLSRQARIFEAIASNGVLAGALHDLARQFGTTTGAFLSCVGELVRAGWVTIETNTEGLFSLHLEP